MLCARALIVLLPCMVAGCGGPGADVINPRLRPEQAPGHVARAIIAMAVDFHGTCSWGRPPGEPARYRVRLRARPDPSGGVLVRQDAWFDLDDTSNVLGELPSGAVVYGDGPVAAPGSPHGAGYGVLIRGHAGRICRGYVSAAYVDVVR